MADAMFFWGAMNNSSGTSSSGGADNVILFSDFYSDTEQSDFGDILLPDGTLITAEQREIVAKAMVQQTAHEVKARIAANQDT